MEALDPFQARIERSLSLTAPILSNFLRQMQTSIGGDVESSLSIDLTRELRGRHFKLIQMLLKNPLQELLSSEVPNLAANWNSDSFFGDADCKETGLLFLVHDTTNQHLNTDGIEWVDQKKMSVKLILHDRMRDIFKVKNAKTDEGEVIMRRRTWHTDDAMGWRRHEYKIYQDQVFYRQIQPGGPQIMETKSVLADFPVVVHYFKKRGEISSSSLMSSSRTRKKQKRSEADEDLDAMSDEDTSSPLAFLRNVLKPSVGNSASGGPATRLVPSALSFGLRYTVFHPSAPLRLPDTRTNEENDDMMEISFTNEQPDLGLPIPPSSASLTDETGSRMFESEPLASISNEFGFESQSSMDVFRPESPTLHAPFGFGFSSPTSSSSSSSAYPWGLRIKSFAPNTGPAHDNTRILFFVEAVNESVAAMLKQALSLHGEALSIDQAQIFASFDGAEVEARLLSENVIEVLTPHKHAGISSVWLCSKTNSPGSSPYTNAGQVFNSPQQPTSPLPGALPISSPIHFFFTPSDESGHLSLAYQLTPQLRSADMMAHFRHTCHSLDLSFNSLEDISFLSGFYHLRSLVLDNNRISQATRFPHLKNLETLSLNSNNIFDIQTSAFMEELSVTCPKLHYLSTLGNECNPFLSRLAHRYYNYRIYVISCITGLRHLDSTEVTDEERRHAASIRPSADISE